MRDRLCLSKKFLIIIVIFFLFVISYFFVFIKLINQPKSIRTRAAETSLSNAFSRKNSFYLSECDGTIGATRISCLSKKLDVAPNDLNSFRKWSLMYKGEKVERNYQSLNTTNEKSSEVHIGPLYMAKGFSQEYASHIIDVINKAWASENVNKKIVLNEKIIWFDSTVKTDCFQVEYWTKATIYFPIEFCEEKSLPIAIQRIGGNDAAVQSGAFMYVDGDYVNFDEEYVYKHELGHVLGAIDSDYVNIRGNDMFPIGNFRDKTDPMADIMYNRSLVVGEFTKYSIDNTPPNTIFNPFKNWQQKIMLDIPEPRTFHYTIYGGIGGASHMDGEIVDTPLCEGELSGSGTINLLTNCIKILFGDGLYKYVAGFIIVDNKVVKYRGKFDFIDMIMSKKEKEPYKKIPIQLVENIPSPTDYLNPVQLHTNLFNQIGAFNSLSDINIAVNDIPNMKLINWNLCWDTKDISDINCNVLLTGTNAVKEGEKLTISIPPALKKYNGMLYLALYGYYQPTSGTSKDIKTFTRSKQVVFVDQPVIQYAYLQELQLIIGGNGFLSYDVPMDIVIDNESISKKNRITISKVTARAITLAVPSYMKTGSHTIVLTRDNLKSEPFILEPSTSSLPSIERYLFNYDYKQTVDTFHLDSNETAIVQLEFKCMKDLSNVVFGVETTALSFNNKYNTSYPSCKNNEIKVLNFQIPAQEIFPKNINESNSQQIDAYGYACAIQSDPTNTYFNDQIPEIISILKLSNTNHLFYNCVMTSPISFQRRTPN